MGSRRRQEPPANPPGRFASRVPTLVLVTAVLSLPLVITPAALANTAADVSAGYVQTCALTTTGGVKCWGENGTGALGDGTTAERHTPVDVSGLTSGVAAITTGGFHTCALTTSGGVKCWGDNSIGELGDGTTLERDTPVDVSGLTSGVAAISAGYGHTCALTTAGGVKCWGWNFTGQVGDGTILERDTPVDVSGLTSGVAAISADGYHTCALTTVGGAKCWGDNGTGQLGDGTTLERDTPVDVSGLTSGVAAVSAGDFHSCALTTSGGAKCWGDNGNGALGDGTTLERDTPVDVSGLTSGVSAVSAGGYHTCALTTSGGVKCWGDNGNGQLGDGTTTISHMPVDVSGLTSGVAAVSAGDGHTCALTILSGVTCWGNNGNGQLGDGTTKIRRKPAVVSGLFGVGVRPDALISRSGTSIGDGVYNTTGSGQTVVAKVRRGKTATFGVRVQNDGDTTDVISIKGSAPSAGFRITVTSGGTDVTAAFLAGTLTSSLAPDARLNLTVAVKVKPATAVGKVNKERVTATSGNDATKKDMVIAKVTVKS